MPVFPSLADPGHALHLFPRAACALLAALLLPLPATAQPSHTLPASLAAPGAPITTILTGLNSSAGIVADNLGNVTVTEPPATRTWRIPAGGTKQALPAAAGLTIRGMTYDAQGRLFFCQADKLSYFDAAGAVKDAAVQRSGGGKLGNNNDLVALEDGSVYFTNGEGNTIYYWKPGSDPIVAASGLNYPNGIEAKESAGKIYVNLYVQPYALASFDIQPDHTLANKQALASIGIPDGLVIDSQGNFYVTSLAEACIAVYSPTGGPLGRITVPGESIHNAAFGGKGNDTLYFTGERASFKMPMKVTGQRDPFKATALRQERYLGYRGASSPSFGAFGVSGALGAGVFRKGDGFRYGFHDGLGRRMPVTMETSRIKAK
jgi:sugar lactone lactonase YvrE